MNRLCPTLLALLCISCMSNPLDSQVERNGETTTITLQSILTKSGISEQEDSLSLVNKLQSDVDNLMMGRVVFKDSIYILAISRDNAGFLGVNDTIYNHYLEYVASLNENL